MKKLPLYQLLTVDNEWTTINRGSFDNFTEVATDALVTAALHSAAKISNFCRSDLWVTWSVHAALFKSSARRDCRGATVAAQANGIAQRKFTAVPARQPSK
jgi:hypothetical protein